ncbi:methyltransferase domain-containing protein [Mycena alexandri]|uniref:Methyltransferase domain-containing protein n=1 Tax=Mycena alexandri TaxID=1745969 RepID=A0AAD6X918_9AGAR|nr:methyltransferase domain-containing protein [Mycena alexandri]
MSRLVSWPIPAVLIFLAALCLLAQQHTNPSELSLNPKSWKKLHTTAAPASCLNQTLEMNEMRYQRAVQERRASIARIGANKPTLYRFPEPFSAFYTLWDLFAPVFSCPFSVWRVGTMGDGGKWVCGLERATTQPNCVVYSMGVERQSSFEQEVLRQSERCQVYGFDFSVSEWGPELRADTAVNSRAHFYPWKMGGVDNHDASPKEYSLQGIMKELGHDFIDIWKIDIEGSEFEALEAVIKSFKGQPLPFGQMEIEIHINYRDYMNTIGAVDKWWTMLEEAGLRPFWTELNLLDVNFLRRGPLVAEWSFINIRGKHALLDDSLPEYP